MICSVSVLGIGIMIFMFSYMVFGDDSDEDIRTLRMTNIIFRHGAKFPDRYYEKDIHQSSDNHDNNGEPGALSQVGSVQMFELGKNLKDRYLKLFPSNGYYSKKIVQVKSSYMERTISSALAFMAGFMPPLEYKNPLPIVWQPIPVNSIPRDRDDLIAQKKACPKYDEAYRKAFQSVDIKELDEANNKLYKILSKHTGENISNIRDVESLYNTLEAEKAAGWTLPDWTEDIFPDKIEPLAARHLALLTETAYMKRIKGGPLMTEIIELMTNKRQHLFNHERTISIYSGHDVTLVNLMRAMNIIDQTSKKPDYSAALVIELHHSLDHIDDYDVKVYYYFSYKDKYPKEISIQNCPRPCSLTQFTKSMNGLIVKEFDEICMYI
ncbi:unnamed protein product [Diamesa tonsa]